MPSRWTNSSCGVPGVVRASADGGLPVAPVSGLAGWESCVFCGGDDRRSGCGRRPPLSGVLGFPVSSALVAFRPVSVAYSSALLSLSFEGVVLSDASGESGRLNDVLLKPGRRRYLPCVAR